MAKRSFSIGQTFERAKESDDLIVEMAFASTEPYERWWGIEVLDVSGAAVRLGRLNDGAPLLFNHNWDDLRGVHVPGSVRADKDQVLRGKVRITSATQAGRDTIALVESGVLSKASVGYQIHKIVEQTTSKSGERIEREIDGSLFERTLDHCMVTRDGRKTHGDKAEFQRVLDQAAGAIDRAADGETVYRVIDWEPLEDSLVTVPADPTVGVGRMASQRTPTPVLQPAAHVAFKGATMAENQAAAGNAEEQQQQQNRAAAHQQQGQQQGSQQSGPNAVDLERNRRRGIENLCKANKIDDNIRDHWIGTGLSVEAITEDLLQIIEARGKTNPQSEAKLGLSESETKRYSLFNAIRAVADKNWSNAGFELECSREISKRLGKMPDPNRFMVPFEVQGRSMPMRRDLTVGTSNAGGFLVETNNMSFIEVLRNRSVAYRMGARRLSGLVGSVTVPRQTAAATAVWLANEASTATESQQTFGQMALSPKTVGAYTEISRQLLLQSSPDAEGIVTADLGAVCALAVDAGVIGGSGASGQPTGITQTAGIGSVTGTSLGYPGIIEFQTDIATANVMPVSGGYVTTPAVAGLMLQRARFTNTDTPLWEGNVWDGKMSGFPAMSSNQMAAATMLFGDWAQVIVGEWGVLEVEVNPYANFQAGIIGIRAMVSMDVGLRYAAAFSLASSIT
jgi:HK97 family phage major capsid protein